MFAMGPGFRNTGAAAGSDPYWSNVVSLLHFDGISGSTTFADQKAVTWAAASGAQLTTVAAKFGVSSGAFLLSGAHISTTTALLSLGSGDFTAEGWFNPTSLPSGVGIFIFDNRLANSLYPCLYYLTGTIRYFTNNADRITATITPTTNAWHHWAVVRISGVTTLYIDGVSQGTTSDAGAYTAAGMVLGNRFDFTAGGNTMYLDETRFTAGVGRYTSNFTPPSSPFPDH